MFIIKINNLFQIHQQLEALSKFPIEQNLPPNQINIMPNQSVYLDNQKFKNNTTTNMRLRTFLRRNPMTFLKIKNQVSGRLKAQPPKKKANRKGKKKIIRKNKQNKRSPKRIKSSDIENNFQKISIKKKLGISFKKISELGQRQRFSLRKQYPRLASYLFLSVAEKQKFFEQKNEKYFTEQKSTKKIKRKQVKFSKINEVIIFDRELAVFKLLDQPKVLERARVEKTEDLSKLSKKIELQTKYLV